MVKPEDVKGWATATPEVKQAIKDAAERYGVDPGLLAQFAAKESSFRATVKASTSSATGLFQFIDKTWMSIVAQGKVYGLSAGSPISARLDPLLNAYAGAALILDNIKATGSTDAGDLYLAHFLGAGTARKVIDSDRATGGAALLVDALGRTAARIAKANPSIVKPGMTVGQLRQWAATAMKKVLIGF